MLDPCERLDKTNGSIMQNVELQVIGLLIFALVVSTSAYLIWKREKNNEPSHLPKLEIGRQKKRYRFLKLDVFRHLIPSQ